MVSFLKKFGKTALKIGNEAVKHAAKSQSSSMRNNKKFNEMKIGGRTILEWERRWTLLGRLSSLDLSQYNNSVGVYKAVLGNETVYIGRAVEYNNGGFRKRLRDYVRESDSARKHGSGKKMYEHRNEIIIYIIETGSDQRAAEVAKKLEKALVMKYAPAWNIQFLG